MYVDRSVSTSPTALVGSHCWRQWHSMLGVSDIENRIHPPDSTNVVESLVNLSHSLLLLFDPIWQYTLSHSYVAGFEGAVESRWHSPHPSRTPIRPHHARRRRRTSHRQHSNSTCRSVCVRVCDSSGGMPIADRIDGSARESDLHLAASQTGRCKIDPNTRKKRGKKEKKTGK